jgi:hypothetical protein
MVTGVLIAHLIVQVSQEVWTKLIVYVMQVIQVLMEVSVQHVGQERIKI